MSMSPHASGLAKLAVTLAYFLVYSLIIGDVEVSSGMVAVERAAMLRLQRTIAVPGRVILPFTSDGCSGGLSAGWNRLSEAVPLFRHQFGDRPPYEDCCLAHDRLYWRGVTEHGYEQRLAADQTLRACVLEHGRAHRDEYARQFALPPAVIDQNFQLIAELMYGAVRTGGGPCTPLPWRWGYGWPACGTPVARGGQATPEGGVP